MIIVFYLTFAINKDTFKFKQTVFLAAYLSKIGN